MFPWLTIFASPRVSMSRRQKFHTQSRINLTPNQWSSSSSMINITLIKFTIQHAKNVRKGYGIPICLTALEFLQLVYLWAHMSTREPDDPFLSHRSRTDHRPRAITEFSRWLLTQRCVFGTTVLHRFLAVQAPLHWNQLHRSTSDALTNAIRTNSEGLERCNEVSS